MEEDLWDSIGEVASSSDYVTEHESDTDISSTSKQNKRIRKTQIDSGGLKKNLFNFLKYIMAKINYLL